MPHPDYNVFHSIDDGVRFLTEQRDQPWVIKASGLAAGKGVIIAQDRVQAITAVQQMKDFGPAGQTYLIEEFLEGEEFSAYAVSDGESYRYLGSAQDHKRLLDGDEGPNTGGMGCISHPLIMTPDVTAQVHSIFQKTFEGMRREGHPYRGVLYLGGMLVQEKVYVIEFNARWGDPEAQVIVPGLTTDLIEIGRAVVQRRVHALRVGIDDKVRVAVAVVARGYPGNVDAVRGKEITGIEEACRRGITVYSAGVRRDGERVLADGGRLLYGVGEGLNAIEAQHAAYYGLEPIHVEGDNGFMRGDIGWRDVARLAAKDE